MNSVVSTKHAQSVAEVFQIEIAQIVIFRTIVIWIAKTVKINVVTISA